MSYPLMEVFRECDGSCDVSPMKIEWFKFEIFPLNSPDFLLYKSLYLLQKNNRGIQNQYLIIHVDIDWRFHEVSELIFFVLWCIFE